MLCVVCVCVVKVVVRSYIEVCWFLKRLSCGSRCAIVGWYELVCREGSIVNWIIGLCKGQIDGGCGRDI